MQISEWIELTVFVFITSKLINYSFQSFNMYVRVIQTDNHLINYTFHPESCVNFANVINTLSSNFCKLLTYILKSIHFPIKQFSEIALLDT